MKHPTYILITTLIIVFAPYQSNAQDEMFGLRAGLNVSYFDGDAERLKSKIGFHAGGLASLILSKWLTYQPEITFSREGNTFEDFEEVKDHLDYLNILPLFFKFSQFTNLNIQAGIHWIPLISKINTGWY